VISDAKEYSAEKEPPITVYYPFEQVAARSMYLVIRTEPDPLTLAAAITKEIQSVDPAQPVFDVKSIDQRLYDSMARRRFSMFLLTVFAVVALILAAIGIYGVMAYSVSHRTREIGIRVALGARPRDVLSLVIRQGIILTLTGALAGLIVALGLTRVMSSLLFGVGAMDPLTFVGVAALLITVALLACLIPARRATKVDPIVALRYE
jgi:putative ABC transport system permease protein